MTKVPRELLFGNPQRALPKISPDGRRMAYLAPDEGVLNIWAGAIGEPAKAVTRDGKRGIRSYFWAEDSRRLLYIQDKDGDENWHLYSADWQGVEVRDLTPFPGVQAQVIGTDPNFKDQVLISLNARDRRLHDVHRLDLSTGKLALEVENPGDVIGWLADARFQARCAKAMRPDGGTDLRVLKGSRWETFLSWGPDDQGGAHGFTPDNAGLYVESSQDSDTTVLWEVALDGSSRKRLASSPGADLAGVLLHPTDFHVQAAAFEQDRLRWTVLDESLKADFEALSRLCEGDFQLVSRDDSDSTWIVLYNSDKKPPRYYRYDRASQRGELLFSTRPALEGYELAEMTPVAIEARDGLTLQGYLTLPPSMKEKKSPLPLILNVHGGPWARDIWGFNPEAQWLASLGYAVLQVNFRGSMGFGKKFLHAGDREWGAKMQDDLTDAVRWAVARGVADKDRVAVYGGSYGGYAALAGAAFTPDLYRCAVDVVGPSNIVTLIRSIPPYWEPMRRIFDLRVGDVDKEEDFLKSRSPLFHVDRINIPLLIAQGANDPRVPQAESEMIVAALKARGKDVEYLLYPDEGHGFARPENRLAFYERAERFLARHLALGG